MRIITGKYKGKHFDVPRTFKARPTTDFAKENIFNVLRAYVDFEDTSVVDLFAGTGSITLEFLSRGCKEVFCVERDRQHFVFITQCLRSLSDAAARPVCGDALKFIVRSNRTFDLIFADPPYALRELGELPDRVMNSQMVKPAVIDEEGNIVSEGTLFVLEHGKDHDFSHRADFLEHRAYGSVNFSIFRKNVKQQNA